MTVPLPTGNSNTLSPTTEPVQSFSTTSLLSGTGTQTAGATGTGTHPDKDEIWSAILKGVASSKMVPTKNVLILGDPNCGKSTLIHYLKNDPGPHAATPDNDDVTAAASFGVTSANYTPMPVDNLDQDVTNTLALGYTFVDVHDEDNEAIARLGMYQLGSSAAEFLPLLKFALNSDTLADSLVIVALDWTRPWKFLESFQRWIDVLQHVIDEICKEGSAGESWSRGKAVVDELREKVEHYILSYTEPSSAMVNGYTLGASSSTSSVPPTPTSFSSTPLVTTTTPVDQSAFPLQPGYLTTNLGVPIILVCCKSDTLSKLEQTQDYKEEQFDFIQQTLRCACMKYGAALFYVSTLHPYTFHNLRQYILHRLLTTSSKTYPFTMKAQIIERDSVMVPAGWDTWGKIRILREGFDCEGVNQGWDADMEAIMDRQEPGSHGARGVYQEAIPDPEIEEQPLNISPPVTCEDEQVFYERHYETLRPMRRPEAGKPRAGSNATRPSVVGPIDVSAATIDLMDDTDSTRASRLKDISGERVGLNRPMPPSIDTMASATTPTGVNGSAAFPGGTDPAGPSNQVIANFFQSLLLRKAASGGGGSPTATSPGSSLPLNGAEEGTARRSTISRREVHKELDRMRQYVNKP